MKQLDPGCEHVTQLAPSVAPQSPVHDGGTTSSHHGPDPPFGVQQGQLQARPTFGIKVCNVSFLGIRQQQVGPVGIPFTKVPDLRTPPLPFPWGHMKRSSFALIEPGKRGCAGPYMPGTKHDGIFKYKNHPSPLSPLRENFPIPLSQLQVLDLLTQVPSLAMSLPLQWSPLPASAAYIIPPSSLSRPHPFCQPSLFHCPGLCHAL